MNLRRVSQWNCGRRSAVRSYLCLTDQRGGRGRGGIIAVLRPTGHWAGKQKQVRERMSQPSTLSTHPVEEAGLLVTLCVRWGESGACYRVKSWTAESERKYSCERELRLHCLGKAGSLGGRRDSRLGCCWRRDAVVKDLGLVTMLLFFVTDENVPIDF